LSSFNLLKPDGILLLPLLVLLLSDSLLLFFEFYLPFDLLPPLQLHLSSGLHLNSSPAVQLVVSLNILLFDANQFKQLLYL